jgi:nicotinate-nucleotide adenylyltransferase
MGEIALFGGSFDPPHLGHLLAAAYVLATEPVDELWFVPVHHHPFQKPMHAPFEHRLRLCEELAKLLHRARASAVEQEVQGEGRTYELLEHLHQKMPGQKFAWIAGTDLDEERKTWKRWDRVMELARIVTVQRGGPKGIPAISSTEIRALLKSGGDVSRLIPLSVADAIRAAGTYR